ncbi:MAG: hypothetical protein WBE38_11815 [Terracidiphilus sp.]|jgi:hypothetical protein
MDNFLESLVAEWYEFTGYFVRRNTRVGKLARGSYEGELDVVAFSPTKNKLIHIEVSSDAGSWPVRESRLTKKFDCGRKYIPGLFSGIALPEIERIAIFSEVRGKRHPSTIANGKLLPMDEFLREVREGLPSSYQQVIHEQFVILRSLQLAKEYWTRA